MIPTIHLPISLPAAALNLHLYLLQPLISVPLSQLYLSISLPAAALNLHSPNLDPCPPLIPVPLSLPAAALNLHSPHLYLLQPLISVPLSQLSLPTSLPAAALNPFLNSCLMMIPFLPPDIIICNRNTDQHTYCSEWFGIHQGGCSYIAI